MIWCFISMPSYKIHSIKNNKKLSFIIDGESIKKVKESLSQDGYIVLTIDSLEEDTSEKNYFLFTALKDSINRIEGKIQAADIFQAYKILKEDYQYIILKLYPVFLTDEKEQDFIFQNVVDVFSWKNNQNKLNKEEEKEEWVKASTIITGEITTVRKYFEILIPLIDQSDIKNKEITIYEMKKIVMTNSLSGMETIMKKVTKILYDQADTKTKKAIYKTILPIVKRTGVFVLPPWYFVLVESIQKITEMWKILFLPVGTPKKTQQQKEKIKKITDSKKNNKQSIEEKYIYSNKNIQLLLQKKYRSSWLDIFKPEGGYLYFYSLMRQIRFLFWVNKFQEYIGTLSMYTWFLLILWFLLVGTFMGTSFFFFNQFLFPFLGLIIVSLVFSTKEI